MNITMIFDEEDVPRLPAGHTIRTTIDVGPTEPLSVSVLNPPYYWTGKRREGTTEYDMVPLSEDEWNSRFA